MRMSFHVAEGNDDFYAFASLWPAKFGALEQNSCPQHLIANAFRAGAAVLGRNSEDGTPIAGTILDLATHTDTLFVPFILISESVSRRAATQRRMLELVLRVFEASGVRRLVFVTDDSKDHRGAVTDFNEAAEKEAVPTALRTIGQAEDLFGDGRSVLFHELFITHRERPDVVSRITNASPADAAAEEVPPPSDPAYPSPLARIASPLGAAGIGAQVLSDRLMAYACCSGCSEKTGKEKEGKEKEGKEGKEGGPKEGKRARKASRGWPPQAS